MHYYMVLTPYGNRQQVNLSFILGSIKISFKNWALKMHPLTF